MSYEPQNQRKNRMTTVCAPKHLGLFEVRVDGKLLWAVLACLLNVATATAGDGSVHWRHAGAMPPGAIGSQRLVGVGSLSAYIQPVEVLAPDGATISFADGRVFGPPEPAPRTVGMQIAQVYRLRVMNVPEHPGVEVYPTIEVIDRLHPPPGEALRFPIPVELTREELLLATRGAFVTRVIYVEDPDQAVATAEEPGRQSWFEAGQGEDPLVVADALGRPIAILRIGGRLPAPNAAESNDFLYGSPPVMLFERKTLQRPGI